MKTAQKKTKIIATIGPASRSEKVIEELILNGVNIFRLNFSHGLPQDHEKTIEYIKAVGKKLNVYPGILADLQGPKIRTGLTKLDKSILLKAGDTVTLTTDKMVSTQTMISIDYAGILDDVFVGEEILINDGAIRLKIDTIQKRKKHVICTVMTTGLFSSHKGVNFPNAKLRIQAFTEKDKKDLDYILLHDVHYIAMSFVRSKADILPLANIVKKSGKLVKIIAKIEKPEAEKNLDEILDVCDGIMVARGDLGIETSPYIVPLLQKNMITRANKKGKLVIVATQMLESMIEHAIPTRAEASDVANAILDGADALMLSGETAVGSYPGLAVETMTKIAQMTEKSAYFPRDIVNLCLRKKHAPHAMCEAAAWASRDLSNIPVLVYSMSGETAFYMSKIRNQSPIFAFSPSTLVVSQLALAWNTQGFLLPFNANIPGLQLEAEQILLKHKLVKKGDLVLVLCGTTPSKGATNFVRVKKIGEE